MAEDSTLLSTEDEVLARVKKLRSLGVTQGEEEICQVLADVENDVDKALLHLQANGKENHKMEVGPSPDKEEEIVVVEDHFGDGVNPPVEGGGTNLPPPYEESVQAEETGTEGERTPQRGVQLGKRKMNISSSPTTQPSGYDPELQFPLTNFYELESRVHADSWSIPVKKDESLGKCLRAAIRLAKAEALDREESCKKFMEKTMPESFDKLMTSDAVLRWDSAVQEGILDMTRLLVELVAERLKHPTVPHQLLEILTNVFNADLNFHIKNRSRRVDSQIWQRRLSGQVFAVSPSFTSFKDPKGWLVELMNTFAHHGGVDAIRDQILDTESLSVQDLTALFQPFGVCDEYINTSFFKDQFGECVTKAVKFVEKMTEADLKQKEVGSVSVLLKTLKTVCLRVWSHESAQKIDQVRLDITLRMLKTPHFNAKMNALKEVVKLIEEPTMSRSRGVKNPISKDRILEWLVENKVLSIALSGNLHQTQYTDKLKSILETIGTRLSLEELDTIWEHQVDKTPVQVENIHNVLAAGAPRFTPRHLDRLFQLIQQSWESASDRYRERLLHLIGKIGRDDRTGKTANKILELLWSMAHTPQLSPEMAEQALDAHCSILVDSTHSKDAERKVYIGKCVEDIKKLTCVVPAFRHLHRIMKGISRNNNRSYQSKEQLQISDLRKQYDLLKMTTSSLIKWQSKAAEREITPELLVDGRYQHREFVSVHLQFLAFLAQDGGIYLPLKRAAEVWDVLIQNPSACADDRTRAFRWFDQGIVDLDTDSQSYLYINRFIKMDPVKLDWAGYKCLKNYFETVNLTHRRLRKMASQNSASLIVETLDVIGGDYLWQACLEVTDEEIASELIADILHISYSGLDSKLKRNSEALHRKFLDNCHGRIKNMLDRGLSKDPGEAVRSQQLQALERLLILMQRYVTMVEDAFHLRRTMPPHGTCFQGDPLTLFVRPENEKQDFRLECHSNECWRSIRQRVARRLKLPVDQLQLGTAERWLNVLLDNRLLRQLGLRDEQDIIVKKLPSTTLASLSGRTSVEETPSNQAAIALEQEKVLPGVIVSELPDIFSTLEQLANIGDPGITSAVHSLLMLLPTDCKVLKDVSRLTQDPTEDLSVSHEVIQRLFDPAKNSPTQLLYSFEVLSGQILPVHEEDSRETSAQDFRKQFLRAGGLKFVINILQKNALPQNVAVNIRQDCYAIALFLARFLLCNETSLPSLRTAVLKRGSSINTSANPEAMSTPPQAQEEYEDVSDGDEMVTDIDAVTSDKNDSLTSAAPHGGRSDEVARLTIEMMSVDDFTTMLAYLVRVAWAAAAGKLHLASAPDGADGEEETSRLQGGVCAMQKDVSSKDAAVAREALELLVTCLQLRRSLLGVFSTMACVGDFVIDVLLGCAHSEVRSAAAGLFHRLCQRGPLSPTPVTVNGEPLPVKKMKISSEDEPRKFFIHLLLQARVPLWTFSPPQKEMEMRLWERCSQFFSLLCRLLEGLSIEHQQAYSVDVAGLLESEMTLMEELCKYTGPTSQMQKLISGHLNLLRALVTCEGINKHSCGPKLVNQVLDYFLFPASNLMAEEVEPLERRVVEISLRCEEEESQVSAYRLLTVLAVGSVENMAVLSQRLIQLHLTEKPEMAKEWEFHPPVIGRAQCGFVGLRNAGATCYMNSVLQQLYMQPAIREMVLTADVEDGESEEEQSIFPEFQSVFGHLMRSRLQYYSPDGFWKKFKLWGNPVNVREQQDAFEFFSNLTDQVDEVLKKSKQLQVFQKTLGGVFLDQKICRGCEHKYEREEPFLSLSLTISTNVMQEALKEFVKGEWLEGDNAYFCEKCQEKRDTLKRTCIKTLPPVLVIHLKRFGYDWEAGRAIKCDDHFEFPWSIDMRPYTAEGVGSVESEDDAPPRPLQYELMGVVVHSGQASAGHYYSYIRQRRPKDTALPEEDEKDKASGGMWYRFNDTVVEEFEMSQESMEAECFGGVYKSGAHLRQDMRTRFWSAYMLFYEAVDPVPVEPDSQAHQEPNTTNTGTESAMVIGDGDLSELTALVRKGEEQVVFQHPSMPSSIQRHIHDENLQFMQHKEVYTPGYFTFIKELVDANLPYLLDHHLWTMTDEERGLLGLASFQLAIHFLVHMYCRTRKKLRSCIGREQWLTTLHHLMRTCPGASEWLLRYLGDPPGSALLKTIFLDCPVAELRLFFSKLLCLTLQTHFDHGGNEENPVDKVLNELLSLLDRDVVDGYKHAAQYFDFMREYGGNCIGGPHLIRKDALMRFITFLMGPPNTKQRPWVPQQVREFRPLFGAISNLLRMTDLTFVFIKNVPDAPPNPYSFQEPLLPASPDFQEWFMRQEECRKFIKECILALREADSMTTEALACSLCCCCYYNEAFSALVLDDLLLQTATHASNELKPSFKVLTDVLLVTDSLQVKRIKYVMEGSKGKPDYGLYNVMSDNKNHDSRRTYLTIKFIVYLANHCESVRDVVMKQSEKWQWSVAWLKKKMKEHYSSPSQTATIVSNDTSGQRSTFQRTISAQNTLEEATELLSEIESHERPKAIARQASGPTSSPQDARKAGAPSQDKQDTFAG